MPTYNLRWSVHHGREQFLAERTVEWNVLPHQGMELEPFVGGASVTIGRVVLDLSGQKGHIDLEPYEEVDGNRYSLLKQGLLASEWTLN